MGADVDWDGATHNHKDYSKGVPIQISVYNVLTEDIAKIIGVNLRTIKREIDTLKEIGVLDQEGQEKQANG